MPWIHTVECSTACTTASRCTTETSTQSWRGPGPTAWRPCSYASASWRTFPSHRRCASATTGCCTPWASTPPAPHRPCAWTDGCTASRRPSRGGGRRLSPWASVASTTTDSSSRRGRTSSGSLRRSSSSPSASTCPCSSTAAPRRRTLRRCGAATATACPAGGLCTPSRARGRSLMCCWSCSRRLRLGSMAAPSRQRSSWRWLPRCLRTASWWRRTRRGAASAARMPVASTLPRSSPPSRRSATWPGAW
mmetsp:Transcript_10735/g.36397  ORF Transcript_10735/g.36397 Transcript_10735/m.36397 type:complete len:249 (+) Transcript_10735:88-834(+)